MNRNANKGKALEDLLILLNNRYRAHKRAVIHKVPTEWIPIRNGEGRFVSAKVQNKAAVDFLGAYRGRPLAYDAKDCSDARIKLSRVEPHQAEFLDDWSANNPGGLSFVLVARLCIEFYVIPWIYWKSYEAARKRGGPASIPFYEIGCYRVKGQDYLAKVDELWPILDGSEGAR